MFIRALRPFKVKKYCLEEHPNYKYTAEADGRYLRKAEYCLEYNNEEIEAVRVKAVGEEGYIKPPVVDSVRRRAQEVERKKKAEAENMLFAWKFVRRIPQKDEIYKRSSEKAGIKLRKAL